MDNFLLKTFFSNPPHSPHHPPGHPLKFELSPMLNSSLSFWSEGLGMVFILFRFLYPTKVRSTYTKFMSLKSKNKIFLKIKALFSIFFLYFTQILLPAAG